MILRVGNVEVFFPKQKIYPEQAQYIRELFEVVQGKGHSLIEMPTGTGKTIALLSFLVSYQIHLATQGVSIDTLRDKSIRRQENLFRIVYCTRTTAELEKVLNELTELHSYILEYLPNLHYTGLGLSARRILCVNETVRGKAAASGIHIDQACHMHRSECEYFQGHLSTPTGSLPRGVHTLESLKRECTQLGRCPYYAARTGIALADCVVYTYNYIIDPRVSETVSSALGSNCVVVFDEAHNIDSACIEALSVSITRITLDGAWRALSVLQELITAANTANNDATLTDYTPEQRLDGISPKYAAMSLSASTRKRTSLVPGSLRGCNRFLSAAKRVVEYMKARLKGAHLTAETTEAFIRHMEGAISIEYSALVHLSRRARTVIAALSSSAAGVSSDFSYLLRVCDLCTLSAQFSKGFTVVYEPFNSVSVYEPTLSLFCLDASIAMKKVFSGYRNVIITSGTLSPISVYPRLLGFSPVKSVEIDTAAQKGLSVLIVTKGSDQMRLSMTDALKEGATTGAAINNNPPNATTNTLSSGFSLRGEPAIVRNYGSLLLEMAAVVPDGLVCFFPSYRYLEEAVSAWTESGILARVSAYKLVFAESLEHEETERALVGYKRACESGRGALLLSVARGKVSEGVDFSGCYGRSVLVAGVPFQYAESPWLKKRLEFLAEEFGIRENEFLSFDAMRQTAQCIGRVLRSENDYGLAVLADRRFTSAEKRVQLPRWVQRHMSEEETNLSIDMCVALGRKFFRRMPTSKYHN